DGAGKGGRASLPGPGGRGRGRHGGGGGGGRRDRRDRPARLLASAGARRDRIFDTRDDLFAAVASAPPTNLTLVTGPSRTADIELTLAIGVHGPERLGAICCRQQGEVLKCATSLTPRP